MRVIPGELAVCECSDDMGLTRTLTEVSEYTSYSWCENSSLIANIAMTEPPVGTECSWLDFAKQISRLASTYFNY